VESQPFVTSQQLIMRKVIPIIFVAATLLVGCKSATMSTTSTAAGTNAVAGTAAAATPPAPVGPNTPEQTLAENKMFGDLAGIFLALLTFAAVKRC
jgi:hypothetical protein